MRRILSTTLVLLALAAAQGASAAKTPPLYPTNLSYDRARTAVNPPVRIPATIPAPPLTETERRIAQSLAGQKEKMVALLERLVAINSGSNNASGVARVGAVIANRLQEMGFRTERIAETVVDPGGAGAPPRTSGPHFIARHPGDAGDTLLLSGHLDTVFEPDSGFTNFTRKNGIPYGPDLTGDVAYGPGVVDMKGGWVVLVFALDALHRAGALDGRTVTVFMAGDEETGTLTARAHLEREARAHDWGLVFESARGTPDEWGGMAIARKGLGQFKITVHGKAAHAGGSHHRGVNAADDLAQKTILLNRLTDYKRGLTVNVGVIDLGPFAKRNRVPAWAQAWVDLRARTMDDALWAEKKIRAIAARQFVYNPWLTEGTRTEVWGVIHRPPMPQTPARDAWYAAIAGLAEILDIPVTAVSSGGGTDGNLMAAVGLTTMESFGPMGRYAHTTDEEVYLDTFEDRATLAALTMYRLWNPPE